MPGGDVSLRHLWRVRLQQVGLGGLDVGHRGNHPLPKTEQVVDGVGGELPHLKKGEENHTVTQTNVQ